MTAALTELLHLQEFMPQVTVLPRVQSDASTWLFQHCKSKKFTNVNQEGDTVWHIYASEGDPAVKWVLRGKVLGGLLSEENQGAEQCVLNDAIFVKWRKNQSVYLYWTVCF